MTVVVVVQFWFVACCIAGLWIAGLQDPLKSSRYLLVWETRGQVVLLDRTRRMGHAWCGVAWCGVVDLIWHIPIYEVILFISSDLFTPYVHVLKRTAWQRLNLLVCATNLGIPSFPFRTSLTVLSTIEALWRSHSKKKKKKGELCVPRFVADYHAVYKLNVFVVLNYWK